MSVRVVSYNLLVPTDAEHPGRYRKCQPQFLRMDYRWNVIQHQLEQQIVLHENTIFCLQELSLTLLPRLELFFRQENYIFFHNLYGKQYNDYMGIGIAIPVAMKVNSINIIKIGDYLGSIVKLREKQDTLSTWGPYLWQLVMARFKELPSDPWTVAINRANTLICLQVAIDGKLLYIGTYHMPCLYQLPDVMSIHGIIVKDLMYQLAAGHPFILAGDFNIMPRDVCYHILTEENCADNHLPESNLYDVSYHPKTNQILKSAYCEKNGVEPAYTNYRDVEHTPNFKETLDYIFYTGNLTVETVLELPEAPTSESYPDETHPSDHLMIAATFRFS